MGSACCQDFKVLIIKPYTMNADTIIVKEPQFSQMSHRRGVLWINDHGMFVSAFCEMNEKANTIVIGKLFGAFKRGG